MENATRSREHRTWALLVLAIVPAAAIVLGAGYVWSSRSQQLNETQQAMVENQSATSVQAHLATLENDRLLGGMTVVLVVVFGSALFRMVIAEINQRRRAEFAHGYAEAMLADKAERDPATGVMNRRGLERVLPGLLADATETDRSVILACLDLDCFKSINDVWGHAVGDQVIRAAAQRLSNYIYEDIRFELCRFGGDRFILFGVTRHRSALWLDALGADMIDAFGKPVPVGGRSHQIGISAGITTSTTESTIDSLALEADSALIIAKQQRGRAVVYNRDVSRTGELVHALPFALSDHEVVTHIQPIVDARDNKILHVEALARWHRASGEEVPPSIFVPLAESYGFTEELTETVLRSVRTMMQLASTPDHMRVWINVSPQELDVLNFGQNFIAQLENLDIAPTRIGLEITETTAITDPTRLGTELGALRQAGVCVAIDDFGSGYTPLGYLRMLPVDTVKLDRALVAYIDTDVANQHIVTGIVGLVHELGMTITAEGVEREEEKRWLVEHGIHQMQGYLFGRPHAPELFDWAAVSPFTEEATAS